jgi:nucleotide-binding universal stress UspA family protein
MLDKIMIATDGSDASRHAASLAISLAKQSNGKVIAVYVVDIQRLAHLPGYTTLHGLKKSLLDVMLKEGEDAVGYIKGKSKDEGVSFEKVILKGNPSDELLRYSKELGADILIIGSIGRTGISKFLLGSVAEKVVRHSEVPVMVVPFNFQ